jgi:hypothetical protein
MLPHYLLLNCFSSVFSGKVEGLKHRMLGEQLLVVTPSREVVLRFSAGEKGKAGTVPVYLNIIY